MSTVALLGKLMEHELELKRLKEQETVEKKVKGIALQTVPSRIRALTKSRSKSTAGESKSTQGVA